MWGARSFPIGTAWYAIAVLIFGCTSTAPTIPVSASPSNPAPLQYAPSLPAPKPVYHPMWRRRISIANHPEYVVQIITVPTASSLIHLHAPTAKH